MGKFEKQQRNYRQKVMRNIIHNIEFEKMVKEMNDEDTYTLNHPSFNSEDGLTLTGLHWKNLLKLWQSGTTA
jgi:hypothetical protein